MALQIVPEPKPLPAPMPVGPDLVRATKRLLGPAGIAMFMARMRADMPLVGNMDNLKEYDGVVLMLGVLREEWLDEEREHAAGACIYGACGRSPEDWYFRELRNHLLSKIDRGFHQLEWDLMIHSTIGQMFWMDEVDRKTILRDLAFGKKMEWEAPSARLVESPHRTPLSFEMVKINPLAAVKIRSS